MDGQYMQAEIRRLERKIEATEAKCKQADDAYMDVLRRLVRLERSERRKKPNGEVKLRVSDLGDIVNDGR